MRTHRRFRGQGFLHASWIVAVLWTTPTPAASTNDLVKHELVGPVKTVVTKHPQLRTVHQFDRNGRLVEVELVPANEADLSHYVFRYDAAGRLIEEDSVEADGHVLYKKLYRYGNDERGRESAVVAATEDGALAHADFSLYDDRGVLMEEVGISGSGIAEKSLYDVRGNLVYTARYFQGKLVLEATHHHGPLGRLKESRFYAGDGSLMRKDFYRYNEAGHRVEQQSEFMRSTHLRKSVVTYEIDQAGNWTKETVQRWTDKNGAVSLSETTVSRERQITYY
jgi:hypothetical protein